jgi:hypothetical protein
MGDREKRPRSPALLVLAIAVAVIITVVLTVVAALLTASRAPGGGLITWMRTRFTGEPIAAGVSDLRLLAGPGSLGQPRWSPDGKLVAFVGSEMKERPAPREGDFIERVVRRILGPKPEPEFEVYFAIVPAGGGRARRVASFAGPWFYFEGRQSAWARDGRSLLYAEETGPYAPSRPGQEETEKELLARLREHRLTVYAVPLTGGPRVKVTSVSATAGAVVVLPLDPYVALSPKGTEVALMAWRRSASRKGHNIAIVNLATGQLRFVTDFADAESRRLAMLNELAWQGDRIYFTCANAGRRVPPNPLPGQAAKAATEVWSVREDGEDLRRTGLPRPALPARISRSLETGASTCARQMGRLGPS